MANRIDFAGKTFGYLTARELTPKVKGVRARQWICDCSACGGIAELPSPKLRAGSVTSCGCRPNLTVRAFTLVQWMRDHKQRLVKSFETAEAAAQPETKFFLEPSGKGVWPSAAENAIEAHELVPLTDGLFSDTAQTWVPA